MHWRRKWQPTPVFLPGESQGRGSLVRCHLWGCTESDTIEVTQQQQQQLSVADSGAVFHKGAVGPGLACAGDQAWPGAGICPPATWTTERL